MFLSRLVPNLRDRGVRRDLDNLYELHRTLLRSFPDETSGGPGRVLFRIDSRAGQMPELLVQSDKDPSWPRLLPGYLTTWDVKPIDGLTFRSGQRLGFRLRANPTKRVGKSTEAAQWQGKRVGLWREEDAAQWLVRKGEGGGFRLTTDVRIIAEGKVTAAKRGHRMQFHAVLFEGILEVTDPQLFLSTLADGIGSGKGFGFGLLSVAPLRA